MELAQGGSLLDYVRQRKRLAEPEACFFLQQIVHGLMHCHDMEVQTVPPALPDSALFLFVFMSWGKAIVMMQAADAESCCALGNQCLGRVAAVLKGMRACCPHAYEFQRHNDSWMAAPAVSLHVFLCDKTFLLSSKQAIARCLYGYGESHLALCHV